MIPVAVYIYIPSDAGQIHSAHLSRSAFGASPPIFILSRAVASPLCFALPSNHVKLIRYVLDNALILLEY